MNEYVTHLACHSAAGHVCQKPSGRTCVEPGCGWPAGTDWGPYWCPPHDEERIVRLSDSLKAIAEAAKS